jgi:hypothetical protein
VYTAERQPNPPRPARHETILPTRSRMVPPHHYGVARAIEGPVSTNLRQSELSRMF